MTKAYLPARASLLACIAAASLSLRCFTGGYLAGVPCEADVECGPALTCDDGVCGGAEELPPPPDAPPPDPPAPRDDRYTIAMGDALLLPADHGDAPLANDGAPAGEPYAAVEQQTETAYGSAFELAADGALAYTPTPAFWGCDAFPYTVTDARGAAGSATVRVTVTPRSVALARVDEHDHGAELAGEAATVDTGVSVAGAGDVNGDGLGDLIIAGQVRAEVPTRARAYVIFGREDWALPSLDDIAAGAGGGFLIEGEQLFVTLLQSRPPSVAGVGDVNGDGLDDVLVGVPNALGDTAQAGRAYLVFGKTDSAPLELSSIAGPLGSGAGGFSLDGFKYLERTGFAVAGAGDMNDDGLDDLVIGTPDFHPDYNMGRAYIVYGKTSNVYVSLETLSPDRGLWIDGPVDDPALLDSDQGDLGAAVDAAGDFNGDGRPDVIIGAPWTVGGGRAYIVFGRPGAPASIDADALTPDQGLEISGSASAASVGASVAGVGDVNGDGRDDVLIGAPDEDGGAGRVYLVYGTESTNPIDLNTLQQTGGGRVLTADTPGGRAGSSVAGPGDVDGDGLMDLLIGAPDVGDEASGRAYLVYGRAGGTPIRLDDLAAGGQGGLAFTSEAIGERAGHDVAGAGDLDGDGRPELLIGAPQNDDANVVPPGRAYVVTTTPCGTQASG